MSGQTFYIGDAVRRDYAWEHDENINAAL